MYECDGRTYFHIFNPIIGTNFFGFWFILSKSFVLLSADNDSMKLEQTFSDGDTLYTLFIISVSNSLPDSGEPGI